MPNDTSVEERERRLRWALLLRSWNIIPIPLVQREKRPIVDNWLAFPMPTESMLRQWIVRENRNYGVICGERSHNLCVVDFDNAEAYASWRINAPALETFTVKSARGVHLYFSLSALPAKKLKMAHGAGDVLTTGAYVVAPGSIHPTGAIYSVVSDCGISRIESLDALALPIERKPAAATYAPRGDVALPTSPSMARIAGVVASFSAAVEGTRNSMLLWSACRCFDEGMSRSDVESLLAPVAMQLGLSEHETLRTIASAQMQERRASISYAPSRNANASKRQLTPRERQQQRRRSR